MQVAHGEARRAVEGLLHYLVAGKAHYFLVRGFNRAGQLRSGLGMVLKAAGVDDG